MSLKDKEQTPIQDTVECVEALAKIVKDNELSRIKISTEDMDIVIEGRPHHKGGMPPHMPPIMPIAPVAAPMGQVQQMASQPAAGTPAAPAVENESGNIIRSKIIGTFYTSPAPEKPPFVRVGDTVKEGDVVCIIESMKLMNEVTSEFSGRVAEIYVNNGDTVEYDQKIMRIE